MCMMLVCVEEEGVVVYGVVVEGLVVVYGGGRASGGRENCGCGSDVSVRGGRGSGGRVCVELKGVLV